MTRTRQMNVYIPVRLKKALDQHSSAQQITLSQLVENIVEEALGKDDDAELLLASVEEKATLRRTLAYLRATKPTDTDRLMMAVMLAANENEN